MPPQPCADVAESSAVACAPPGAETLVACPTPNAKPVASEDAARTSALALVAKLGLPAQAADVHVDQGYDGVRHVSVQRRIEGRPVEGLATQIAVAVNGAVVSASGQLAEPVVAGEYPMVPAAEATKRIVQTRVRMMLCRQTPGVEGCAPPPPIVVTGASVGLSLVWPADYEKGEAYLLPAWFFTIEGEPTPAVVVAVPSRYRGEPDPPEVVGGGGKIVPAPGPPATAPVPALPPGVAPAGPNEPTDPAAPQDSRSAAP